MLGFQDEGKEIGTSRCLCLTRGVHEVWALGLFRDNGKENGNYWDSIRIIGYTYIGVWGPLVGQQNCFRRCCGPILVTRHVFNLPRLSSGRHEPCSPTSLLVSAQPLYSLTSPHMREFSDMGGPQKRGPILLWAPLKGSLM